MNNEFFNVDSVRSLSEWLLRHTTVYIKESCFKEGLKRNLEAVIDACEAEQEHLSGFVRMGDL